jgi:hypothetical protein
MICGEHSSILSKLGCRENDHCEPCRLRRGKLPYWWLSPSPMLIGEGRRMLGTKPRIPHHVPTSRPDGMRFAHSA